MRVISGLAKGKKLQTLSGEMTRPTSDRIKEAIFSVIQFEINGKKFLDLFSGSGQMGIEAISRGAASSTFVESSKEAFNIIKSNLKLTNLQDKAKMFNMDSFLFLKNNTDKFDIVYLDPPYLSDHLENAIVLIEPFINPGGVIFCEHPISKSLNKIVGDFGVTKEYKYGKIAITIYKEVKPLYN